MFAAIARRARARDVRAVASVRTLATRARGGSGSGGSLTLGAIAAIVAGAGAFDAAFGPPSSGSDGWESWIERRRKYYSRELGKLNEYAKQGFSREYKQDVFFSYERRLRTFSPPEKVFDYFASVHKDGRTYMTLSDLVRSLLPLHPAVGSDDTRAGKLHGEMDGNADDGKKVSKEIIESKLFRLFDTDGNGLFDFSEYLFFNTLLTTDKQSSTTVFHMYDVDGSGELDEEEFRAMMKQMRTQVKHATGLRTGLNTGGAKVDDIGDRLLDYLFSPKRNKKLSLKQFHEFLQTLRHEMDVLEFAHYASNKGGQMTLRDFGYTLVANCKVDHLATFMEQVKTLPGLESKKRIKREEFLAFARIAKHGDGKFQKEMKEVSDSDVDITRKRFKDIAKRTAGVRLSDEIVNIVFHIFDVNNDDSLSYDEFFNALKTWK